MEEAVKDVKRKAIELKKQSIQIEQKAKTIDNPEVQQKMLKLSKNLSDKAEEYKVKHESYKTKLSELSARRILAEETRKLLQLDLGLSNDDVLATLGNFEKDIQDLEAEVQAHFDMQ
jgi:phage shock protein A